MKNPIDPPPSCTLPLSSHGVLLQAFRSWPLLVVLLPLLGGCPPGSPPPGFPEVSGCVASPVVVGDDQVLTVSVTGAELVGVAPTISGNAEVTSTRTGPSTFEVVVTPREAGDVLLQLEIATDSVGTSTFDFECELTAISDLGACCDSIICDVTSKDFCDDAGRTFHGPGTTCSPTPCSGACCGSDPNETASCDILTMSECTAVGGTYGGDGSECPGACACESTADCADDDDPCMVPYCALGVCGLRHKCAGSMGCDQATGECAMDITLIDFPVSLNNGQTADLGITWTGPNPNLQITAVFGAEVGTCPEGFSCPSRTLTLQLDNNPFVIPDAFTCRIDGATEAVPFRYEVSLVDSEGFGSDVPIVTFSCVP